LLCLWITQPKRGFYFLASAGLLSVGAFLVMNHYYEGWFYYYLFEVPRGHALYTNLFSYFWRYDLVGPAAIACSFSLIFLITNIFEKDTLKKAFYFFIPAALLTISAASRIHSEAYSNVLFPAYAALAIMTPMALKRILSDRTRTAGLRLGPWLGLILMLAQFYQLYYPAARHMPTAYDLAAGQRLIRVIQSIPGDVLIPYHGFLSTQSGKSPSAQAMGVYDVLRSPDHAGACLIDAYRQQILSKKYEAVILDDSESFLTFGNELKKLYGKKIPLFRMETVFRPRTGSYFRPVNIVFLKGSESEAKIKALLNQPISLTDIESHPR